MCSCVWSVHELAATAMYQDFGFMSRLVLLRGSSSHDRSTYILLTMTKTAICRDGTKWNFLQCHGNDWIRAKIHLYLAVSYDKILALWGFATVPRSPCELQGMTHQDKVSAVIWNHITYNKRICCQSLGLQAKVGKNRDITAMLAISIWIIAVKFY